MKITLVLDAGLIPDGSIVHKPHGEKPYILRRELKFHQHSFSVMDDYHAVHGFNSLIAPKGVFLLDNNGGNIITLRETEKLAFDVTLEAALELLTNIRDSA